MKTYLRECPRYEPTLLATTVRQILAEEGLEVRGATVLVKPSFVYPARAPSSVAVSTHPALLRAVCEVLRERGASRVLVAEDSLFGPSEVAFSAMGVARDLDGIAELVPLQKAPRVSVEVSRPFIEERFVVPRVWLEADLYVSLPKLKVNLYTDVTLSVKNNFGLLLQRHRLPNHHHGLHRKIADLYKVRPPDFVVCDSIVVGEGQGPMAAEPVELGVLLAGANGLAVDAVACHLMGFDPLEVEHLRLLHGAGLGPIDLAGTGLDDPGLLARRRTRLRRPKVDFDAFRSVLQVVQGSEVCCTSGCAGMVRNSLDQWLAAGRLDALAGLTFVVGKPVDHLPPCDPRRTLVVGDCAMAHARAGRFLPGCPVPPLAVVTELARMGRLVPLRARVGDLAAGYLAHLVGSLRARAASRRRPRPLAR